MLVETKEKLVGYCYPAVEPISERRFARHWIVRLARDVVESDLNGVREAVERGLEDLVIQAYAAPASAEQKRDNRPSIAFSQFSARHVVVTIEAPTPTFALGDAAALITWGALRAVDDKFCIEDLQGLPKSLWHPLTWVAKLP